MFMKIFRNNYELAEKDNNDTVFGSVNLHRNINSGVIEVVEKVLGFNDETENKKAIATMQNRLNKPHPNLIRIYDTEYM